eukprot:14564253-Alexandrium_andersonii.AAC.1
MRKSWERQLRRRAMRSEDSGAPRREAAQTLEGGAPTSCRPSRRRRASRGGPGTTDVALREA